MGGRDGMRGRGREGRDEREGGDGIRGRGRGWRDGEGFPCTTHQTISNRGGLGTRL